MKWIDLIRFDIQPQPLETVPVLLATFTIRNETDKNLLVLPGKCTLKLLHGLVGNSISYFALGKQTFGSTAEDSSITIAERSLSRKSEMHLYSEFELDSIKLSYVMKKLQGLPPKSRKVNFEALLSLKLLNLDAQETQDVQIRKTGWISGDDWYQWIDNWGIHINWIYLPAELANKLRQLRSKMSVSSEWEVIDELVKKGEDVHPKFTFLSEDMLQSKMKEVISNAKKQIFILCRGLDRTLSDEIVKASEKRVDVKIVLVPPKKLKEEKYKEISRLEEAIEVLSKKVQIRTNVKQHARVLLSENEAIIGSTDPDYYGLKLHLNASVYTNDGTIIKASQMFFQKIWEDSKPI